MHSPPKLLYGSYLRIGRWPFCRRVCTVPPIHLKKKSPSQGWSQIYGLSMVWPEHAPWMGLSRRTGSKEPQALGRWIQSSHFSPFIIYSPLFLLRFSFPGTAAHWKIGSTLGRAISDDEALESLAFGGLSSSVYSACSKHIIALLFN